MWKIRKCFYKIIPKIINVKHLFVFQTTKDSSNRMFIGCFRDLFLISGFIPRNQETVSKIDMSQKTFDKIYKTDFLKCQRLCIEYLR